MTFREVMIKAMTSRGMFEAHAEQVMTEYVRSPEAILMDGRWDDHVEDYPDSMQNLVWIGVKECAAEWISNNLPMAWFRPMFQYTEEELDEMILKWKEGKKDGIFEAGRV